MEETGTPEERLAALGIGLHPSPAPLGSYQPCVRTGSLVYLSGILPLRSGLLKVAGRVGESVTPEDARAEARQAVVNALAALRDCLGSLSLVTRCVKVNGYVASAEDFTGQPEVLNAASDLIVQVFGEKGRHARSAVGVCALPLNAAVEIDFIFETAP